MTDSNDTLIQLELPLTDEEWRDIPGYEGIYQVSDLGRVKRITKHRRYAANRLLKPIAHNMGYVEVILCCGTEQKRYYIHRLILATFIGECPSGMQVNHKNGIKTDNRLENLEYVTRSQNIKHSYDVLKRQRPIGESAINARLTESQVREIRRLLKLGARPVDLAKQFDVHKNTIHSIKNKSNWKHVKD